MNHEKMLHSDLEGLKSFLNHCKSNNNRFLSDPKMEIIDYGITIFLDITKRISRNIFDYDLVINSCCTYIDALCKIELNNEFIIKFSINIGIGTTVKVSAVIPEDKINSNEPIWEYSFTIENKEYGWYAVKVGFNAEPHSVSEEEVIKAITKNCSIEKYIKDRNEYIEKKMNNKEK